MWFDIIVELWQWILSQVIGVFSLVMMFISFQAKTKSRVLTIMCIGVTSGIIGLSLLENWVMVGLLSVTLVRNLTFIYLDKKDSEIPKDFSVFVLVLFMLLATYTVFWTNRWWFDWLLLGATLFSTYGKWAKGIHLIRISSVTFSALAIVNAVEFHNLMGILIDIVIICSIGFFYIKFFRNKKSTAKSGIKIHFLGTGDMGTKRGCTSFVLENKEKHILFDCGFGTIRALVESGLDVYDINVLVLSHFHIDHTGDLLYFFNRREYQSFHEGVFNGTYVKEKKPERMKPVTIIAPSGFNKYLLGVYNGQIGVNHKTLAECTYLDLHNVTIVEMNCGDKFTGDANSSCDGIEIKAFTVQHQSQTPGLAKIPLGYTIKINNETIGCSGDTSMCDNLIKNLENADTWVIDCARGKGWKTSGRHLNCDEIEGLATQYPNKKFYCVHRRFEDIPSAPSNILFPKDGDF